MADNKKSFVLYNDYKKHIDLLTDEQAGQLFKGIYAYINNLEPYPMDSTTAMAFSFIQMQLDRDISKYQEICVKRKKAIEARWEKEKNTNDTNVYKSNFCNTNDTDNDNDNENDNENENVNENDTDTDNVINNRRRKAKPSVVKVYSSIPELNEAILSFIDYRKKLKKPMTDRAVELLINKLNSMTSDITEQVEILNQSIVNGWQGVFPLKQEQQPRNFSKPSKAEELDSFYDMCREFAEGE